MKIILVSFFKSNNLGDLLIAKNILSSFGEHEVNCIDFPTRSNVKEIKVNYDLKKVEIPQKKSNFKKALFEWYSYFLLRFNKKFWMEYKDLVSKSDILVVGGGNMMMDIGFAPLYSYLFYKYVKIANSYNKKVYVVSVGVGPFKNFLQTHYIKKSVNNVEYIWTRDAYSRDVLKNINNKCNAHLSADAAFAYKSLSKKSIKNKKIGVCIADYICVSDFCNYDCYNIAVKNILTILKKEFSEYKIEVFSTEKRDYTFINYLFENNDFGDQISIKQISSLDELKLFYNEIDFIIGMRMHSLILGMICHLPCFAISWQKKINSLYDGFEISEQCIDFTTNYYDMEFFITRILNKSNLFDDFVALQDKHIDISRKRFYEQLDVLLENNYSEEKKHE